MANFKSILLFILLIRRISTFCYGVQRKSLKQSMRLTCQSKVRENLLPTGKDKGPEGEREVKNVTLVSTCSRMRPVQVHSLHDSRALSAVGRPEADKPCIDGAEKKGLRNKRGSCKGSRR